MTAEDLKQHRRILGLAFDAGQHKQINGLIDLLVADSAIRDAALALDEAAHGEKFALVFDRTMRSAAAPRGVRAIYREKPEAAVSLRAVAAHFTYRKLNPNPAASAVPAAGPAATAAIAAKALHAAPSPAPAVTSSAAQVNVAPVRTAERTGR